MPKMIKTLWRLYANHTTAYLYHYLGIPSDVTRRRGLGWRSSSLTIRIQKRRGDRKSSYFLQSLWLGEGWSTGCFRPLWFTSSPTRRILHDFFFGQVLTYDRQRDKEITRAREKVRFGCMHTFQNPRFNITNSENKPEERTARSRNPNEVSNDNTKLYERAKR